jgi:hypothetical protein
LLLAPLTAACESDEPSGPAQRADAGGGTDAGEPVSTDAGGGDEGQGADASVDADAGKPASDNPAILVAVFVRNPEGRNIYVGAVPKVPTGKLDYSQFLEFDSIDAYTANGFVYVWDREPAQMTQYSVDENLQLVKGKTADFLELGLSGGGIPSFASEHLAYILSPALDVIAKFDPTTMEVLGSIEVDRPDRPGLDTYGVEVTRFGKSTAWVISSENYDALEVYHGVTLLLLEDGAEEAKLIEDDRCAGGPDGVFVDGKGDLYVRGNATWGLYAAFGKEAKSVRTCTLRVRKGESEFDKDYLLDHKELTGTYVNGPWFHIEGSRFVANVWADETMIPETPDEFFGGTGYKSLLVDIEKRTAEPYPALDGQVLVSSIEFNVDGQPYYQFSKTGSVVGGTTDVVKLNVDGIEDAFELPELWSLARIR